ncbi:GTP cyclohydrolase 1 type 2 like protein [Lentibacillus sp. JNUCC-1]|nr:GTP cyclohydrolase 1 type 2 like protein [Lentibacillus sp. JNUCC-1]
MEKLLKHDITVYASHTNLDVAAGGVNDMLCKCIGLGETAILDETDEEPLFKVVVYVPDEHADAVRSALGKAGGGFIGDYSHCTFNTTGKGTFKPTEEADPFIGEINELTVVSETKIETIVSKTDLDLLIQAMLQAHPYEEAAYDIYKMANEGVKRGIGRIGDLPEQKTLRELADHVKTNLDVPMVRTVGDLSSHVKTVAILGGSGEKFISSALKNKADVLVTGDLTFHAAQDALEAGLMIIDPGHHVEKVMKSATKAYLENNLDDDAVKIYASEVNTEPFQFV